MTTIPDYPGDHGTLDEWIKWHEFLMDGNFRPHLSDILTESIGFAEKRITRLQERETRKGGCEGTNKQVSSHSLSQPPGVGTGAKIDAPPASETPPPVDD